MSNVDRADGLEALLRSIAAAARGLPVILPVHPRTATMLGAMRDLPPNLRLIDAQPYLQFNYLVRSAKAVITDSGGVTEEATVLGVPCLTLRSTTERPETVTIGTNVLLGTDPAAIGPALDLLFAGEWKKGGVPELWDGRAGERIVAALETWLAPSA